MSHTIKGSKGAGYEYWSRRPFNQSTPGKFSKHRTHKAERQLDKKEIELGFLEVEELWHEENERTLNAYYDSLWYDDLDCGNTYCDICGDAIRNIDD